MAVVEAEVDHRDAVRVLEPRHQLGFALEPLARRELVRQRVMHDLDRDRASELQALAAIDRAHRTLGDRLDDLVAVVEHGSAEVGTRSRREDSIPRVGARRALVVYPVASLAVGVRPAGVVPTGMVRFLVVLALSVVSKSRRRPARVAPRGSRES